MDEKSAVFVFCVLLTCWVDKSVTYDMYFKLIFEQFIVFILVFQLVLLIQDGTLSKAEMLDKYDLFVGSQATDFGEALTKHDEF